MVAGSTVTDIDKSIVERACFGDDRAFALLVEHHAPMMRALALRVLGDAASVDDALQEAYAMPSGLFRPSGAPPGSAPGWTESENFCTDELRRRRRAPACIDGVEPSTVATAGGEERALDRDVLTHALSTLSAKPRTTVLLVYVEGFTYAEAAEALGNTGVFARSPEERSHGATG